MSLLRPHSLISRLLLCYQHSFLVESCFFVHTNGSLSADAICSDFAYPCRMESFTWQRTDLYLFLKTGYDK